MSYPSNNVQRANCAAEDSQSYGETYPKQQIAKYRFENIVMKGRPGMIQGK
jgi:hypothetical protein